MPDTTLGVLTSPKSRLPRIDALGAVPEMELAARGEARFLLQDRRHELLGRAWVRRGLQHDGRARSEVARQGAGRGPDVGEVGHAVPQRRGHGDHGHIEAGTSGRIGRGRVAPGHEGRRQSLRRHVLDVRLTGEEVLDPRLIGLVAHDGEADLCRTHRKGQADVPLSDHNDPRAAVHRVALGCCLLGAAAPPVLVGRRRCPRHVSPFVSRGHVRYRPPIRPRLDRQPSIGT